MIRRYIFFIILLTFVVSINAARVVEARLTWSLNPVCENIQSYTVYMASGNNNKFIPMVTVPGTTNVGVIKRLSTQNTYRFMVKAKNFYGESYPSQIVTIPANSVIAFVETDSFAVKYIEKKEL